MTKEKEMARFSKLIFCLLVILTMSLLLNLPILKVSASQASDARPIMSKEIIETTNISDLTEAIHKTVKAKDATESLIKINEMPDFICLDANPGGTASNEELDVLIHLINAEAYGLSYKAKVAVGQVVMNRWTGPYYGDNLYAIMTAPYQFTPIYNGSAYKKEIEPDSIKAAYAVLNGDGVVELTDDTYYFVNPDFTEDKTIEQSMEFVCEIENIHFYKPSAK